MMASTLVRSARTSIESSCLAVRASVPPGVSEEAGSGASGIAAPEAEDALWFIARMRRRSRGRRAKRPRGHEGEHRRQEEDENASQELSSSPNGVGESTSERARVPSRGTEIRSILRRWDEWERVVRCVRARTRCNNRPTRGRRPVTANPGMPTGASKNFSGRTGSRTSKHPTASQTARVKVWIRAPVVSRGLAPVRELVGKTATDERLEALVYCTERDARKLMADRAEDVVGRRVGVGGA